MERSEYISSDDELKRLAFEVMAAGTDTTSLTLTWACAYLSCTREYFSPEDIRTHLMRIHRRASVVPLALPHLVRENIMVSRYEIPAGSILIYNLYAVHQKQLEREETSPNPIPFSVGGRSCPGNRLATRVLEHIISEINKSFTVDRIDEGPADSSMKGLTRGPDNALFIFRPRNPVVNDVQRVVY
ncbi:unnamed protein product [Calicophoron daubneyi]|uniref:C2H2-type domain-containing protein n=1 Tax=Calicophoron daubneyi TaxID=300641 RepID=A0AAV2TJQ9_CALDB